MIRRTNESRYGDRPIIELSPEHIRTYAVGPAKSRDQNNVTKLANKVRSILNSVGQAAAHSVVGGAGVDGEGRAFFQLGMCATFPGMAGIFLSGNNTLRFDHQEHEGILVEQIGQSIYGPYLNPIFSDSPKLTKLYKLVREMLGDRERPTASGLSGAAIPQKKMLVFTKRRPTAFFVTAALQRAFPNLAVLHLGETSVQRRAELLAPFGRAGVSSDDEPRICVGTYGKFAYGHDLYGANHVVLMEPPGMETMEDQAFGRVHRLGQVFETHLSRIQCPGNPAEKLAIVRQEARASVLDVDEIWRAFGLLSD